MHRLPFLDYLLEEIDEGFDLLKRFEGLPGGGPGTPFETWGRLFGDLFAGIAWDGCIFGIFDLEVSFVRLTFEFSSSISRFRFTFGMTTSS